MYMRNEMSIIDFCKSHRSTEGKILFLFKATAIIYNNQGSLLQ